MTSAQRQPSLLGVRARLAWALWAESSCGADHPGHGLSAPPPPKRRVLKWLYRRGLAWASVGADGRFTCLHSRKLLPRGLCSASGSCPAPASLSRGRCRHLGLGECGVSSRGLVPSPGSSGTGSAGEAFLSTIQKAAEVVANAVRPGPGACDTQGPLQGDAYQAAVTPAASLGHPTPGNPPPGAVPGIRGTRPDSSHGVSFPLSGPEGALELLPVTCQGWVCST